MEWNISLAIFLATKCVLLFGSYFLRFLVRWASAGWRKTILISVRSTGPRPLVLNRAGLASAAAIRAGLLGRGLLGGSGICRPWLNRAGLHLFGVMCCYRAEELWHVSHLVSRGVKWADMSFSKGRCN